MSILIYRTGQLGDTIVSLPAMRAIRAAFPNHSLILLTDQQPSSELVSTWEILGAAGIFSEVLFYVSPSIAATGWLHLLNLAVQIRRLKPEFLFYFRDFPWNHVRRDAFFFRALCGIRRCYGLEDGEVEFGRRDASGQMVCFPSEVDRLLGIVATAGVSIPPDGGARFWLPNATKERLRVEELWQQLDISDQLPVIGLGPGSKMAAKRWPLERFKEVGRRLLASFPDCRLMIFGGLGDHALGEGLRQALGERVLNVAGLLSVLESAEALRRCHVYIGNDSGVMHLAAAVGTPCVAIFSARDHPGRWEPYGVGHVVLRKEPPCAGCLLEVCIEREMVCLEEIQVSEVLAAIQRVLLVKQVGKDHVGTESATVEG